MVISKLAEGRPEEPAAVGAWLDTIEDRTHQTATADTHDLPPDQFITTALAIALGQVLNQPQPAPRHWYPHLVRDAVTTLDVDTLGQLCRAHERVLSQDGRPFPEMHVTLAATTLAVATDDWPGDDHEERVARAATVLAATVYLTWQETRLDGEHFEELVDAVKTIEDEDPDLYADLVRAVPERLDANHDNLIAGLNWQAAFR